MGTLVLQWKKKVVEGVNNVNKIVLIMMLLNLFDLKQW